MQGYYFYKPMPASDIEKLLMLADGGGFDDVLQAVMAQEETDFKEG